MLTDNAALSTACASEPTCSVKTDATASLKSKVTEKTAIRLIDLSFSPLSDDLNPEDLSGFLHVEDLSELANRLCATADDISP